MTNLEPEVQELSLAGRLMAARYWKVKSTFSRVCINAKMACLVMFLVWKKPQPAAQSHPCFWFDQATDAVYKNNDQAKSASISSPKSLLISLFNLDKQACEYI